MLVHRRAYGVRGTKRRVDRTRLPQGAPGRAGGDWGMGWVV